MIELLSTGSEKILGFKVSRTLHDQDYKVFVPAVEAALAAQGKLRLFVQFEDFHGWDLHAAWDDIKFAAKHYADLERIALVGESQWQAWMARFCKPFTRATVKYYPTSAAAEAWAWVREGL